MKKLGLVLIGLVVLVSGAQAATIDTSFGRGADTYVYGHNPDTNYGASTAALLLDYNDDTWNAKGFLRFDISEILTPGRTFESASLNFFATSTGTTTHLIAYGLEDGSAGDMEYGWTEDGITWNNRPTGNYTAVGDRSYTDANVWKTFDLNDEQALLDFLNSDTNGIVTFMIDRQDNKSLNSYFATKEREGAFAPYIRYSTVTEFLYGDANGDGVVSAGDYAAVQSNFGAVAGATSTTTPEPATMSLLAIGGTALLRRKRK